MKILLISLGPLFVAAFALFGLFVFWASRESLSAKKYRNKIVNENGSDGGSSEKIKVLSWNIAWGYGIGSEGTGYRPKCKDFFLENLDSMAKVIRDSGADIVLIQEADFDSDKSHNIDQLKYLAEKLGMNRAYALGWDLNYLPFPYWPVQDHFGKVSSGGGVLSKFPILSNDIAHWDKPASNSWWYNLFYLDRYSQFVSIQIKGRKYVLVNSHLEAFDKIQRKKQASKLALRLESAKNLLVSGGDFNTVPRGASRTKGFEDPRDDYGGDETYGILAGTRGLKDTLALEDYAADETRWFTFSSVKPSRKLDYIFVNQKAKTGELQVIQSPASDHLPIMVEVEL